MGRKSTKQNKNIYQVSREEAGYTRESAAELLEYIAKIGDDKLRQFVSNIYQENKEKILIKIYVLEKLK